jgi:hypothetical protein
MQAFGGTALQRSQWLQWLRPDAAVALVYCSCRLENLAATQNKLLMRVAQLRATEALFCDLLTSCPAAALQLPDLSYPLLTAVVGGKGGLCSSSHGCAGSGGSSKAASSR